MLIKKKLIRKDYFQVSNPKISKDRYFKNFKDLKSNYKSRWGNI